MEQEATIEKPKQRHGCLIAFLIYLIVANAITTVFNILKTADIQRQYPRFPLWGIWALPVLGVLNIFFALALFRWKKWGFFGYALTSLSIFALNVYGGVGILFTINILVGVVILFVALQIGGERKGWPQLE